MIIFLEVVRAGSLTAAARRLHTVQSNVTARVKRLERATGSTLLRRHARGIRPTPAGEAVVVLAQRVAGALDDLRFTFERGARTGMKLRLGSIETTAASHLPPVVASFARQHPAVDISVQSGSSASLLKLLKNGELDAAFVSRAPGLPGFQEFPVFADELAIVAPATFRSTAVLLAPAATPVKVLVQRLGCSYTERLLGFLAEKSKRSCQLQELGTLEGVLGFVAIGEGVAAMPLAFAKAAAGKRPVRLLPLPPKYARLDTYVVAPAAPDASFVVNEFIAALRERSARGAAA
ncbi:MAG TPA: LysR family transcriptional regulator [Lacunisphaera sp.]